MTVVRFKNKPVAGRYFNNFVDDLFNPIPSILGNHLGVPNATTSVPVNLKEKDNGYELDVIAPGLNKEDFKIDLEENLLTISADKKAAEEKESERQVRREYAFQAFKRSFTLEENIDVENISAQYVNGVLTLNLPRKTAVKEPVKTITVQ